MADGQGGEHDRQVRLWIEHQTGWSIKRLVRAARRYCTIQIKAGR
jgi:hypothetical protein